MAYNKKFGLKGIVSYHSSFISSQRGQSLVEVVIGLAIGAILMGTAAFAVTTMLRTNLTSEKSQFASQFAQSLSDNVRSYAAGSWDNLYNLTKGLSAHYFLNASGTTFFVVQGEEGMLDGEVTDGLVGQWKLDEVETTTSTTTYDATGNGNHSVFVGSPVRTTSTCRIGNCIQFDGTAQYFDLIGNFTPDDDFTFSLWVNFESIGPAPGGLMLGGHTDGAYGFGRTSDTQIRFGSRQVGTTTLRSVAFNPSLDTWYHLVGTHEGNSKIALYVDGTLVGSSTISTISSYDAGAVRVNGVGTLSGSALGRFAGTVDDVRIYNRVLSTDEVRQLYNSGIYKRFFTVENVCRTNDASSTIAGTAPCSGTSEDSSTQWVKTFVQWVTGSGTNELSLPTVITRSQNAVFHQTDWSGGVADEGPVVKPTSRFASSTNASTTGGSIQIENLSQE